MESQNSDNKPTTSQRLMRKRKITGRQNMINKKNIYVKCKIRNVQKLKQDPPINDLDELKLPLISEIFVGRTEEIKQLNNLFKNFQKKKVIITGIAGLGKTRLAIQYAQQEVNEKIYSDAFYVIAENEKNATEKIISITKKITNNSKKKYLLILDNVTEESNIVELLSILKETTNINILATSQLRELRQLFHQINLNKLKPEEGAELVINLVKESNTNLQENDDDAADSFSIGEEEESLIKQLVNDLDCHTLALKHAASLIINKTIYGTSTFSENIKYYLTKLKKMLDDPFPIESKPLDYTKTTFFVIKMNVEMATEISYVRDILFTASFMDPNYLDLDKFHKYSIFEADQIEEARKLLRKHSILETIDKPNKSIIEKSFHQIHRLISIVCLKLMQLCQVEHHIVKIYFQIHLAEFYEETLKRLPHGFYTRLAPKHNLLLNNTNLSKDDIGKLYIDTYRNHPIMMKLLWNRLQLIELNIDAIEKWTASHYSLFIEDRNLYNYFQDADKSELESDWPLTAIELLSGSYPASNLYENDIFFEKKLFGGLSHFILYVACSFDSNIFKHLLNKSNNILTDDEKSSLLNLIIRNKKYDLGYELIKSGTNYDSIGEDKALICAVAGGDLNLSQQLIQNGANGNFQDDEGCSSIYYAIFSRNIELFSLLVENGVRIEWKLKMRNLKDKILLLLLNTLFMWPNDDPLEIFLNSETLIRVSLNARNINLKETDLLKIVKYLIESDANVNGMEQSVKTPLMFALENRFESVANLLIDNNANIHLETSGGTMLIYAIRANLGIIALRLIEEKVDVNKVDQFGRTPLILAIEAKLDDVALQLIKEEVDVDKKDKSGKTALDYAKNNNLDRVVSELMKLKAVPT